MSIKWMSYLFQFSQEKSNEYFKIKKIIENERKIKSFLINHTIIPIYMT